MWKYSHTLSPSKSTSLNPNVIPLSNTLLFILSKKNKSKNEEETNKETELFKALKEASKTNPNLTYEEFLKK